MQNFYLSTRLQNGCRLIISPSQPQAHLSSFLREEITTNRRPFTTSTNAYIRRRVLPVIKSTGQVITQAEIDDAFDD